MKQYKAGVIGLGWMGMLYDLAQRIGDKFEIDDADRPTPQLDVHKRIHHHEHPGGEGNPSSYAEAIYDRPDVELVAAADRDVKRLGAFTERYGISNVYTDAEEMLEKEKLDIVAVATNTKGRSHFTCMASNLGAKGIFTEKPMAHTLAEVDEMVATCAKNGTALSCGAISTTHPSFERAKRMINEGAIGEVMSIEAAGPAAQHQNWSYFLDSEPDWVVGIGDKPRAESGSSEFKGQGMLVAKDGTIVHFRYGAPGVRITGTKGEIFYGYASKWTLLQNIKVEQSDGEYEVLNQMPWPHPQFSPPYGGIYSLDDVVRTINGDLDEPKNSGKRVGTAIEVEIALKQSSAAGGVKVELPLNDRSLGLHYDWFR